MNINQLLSSICPHFNLQINSEQEAVIRHGTGPLWIIAGPGSGKTEVLVLRCLKLACIDMVPPRSIVFTTFTDKAAKNIQDRIAIYKTFLDNIYPSLKRIDLFQLRIGTLHSLCNDIMQEYRYKGYQNYRLLNEFDQLLFIYEHANLASSKVPQSIYLPLWQHFHYLVSHYSQLTGNKWKRTNTYLPHRWLRAKAAIQLFNRIVEDHINVNQMRAQGGIWTTLADDYEAYRNNLEANLRCDFAHLQQKLIVFLSTPNGARFLNGDGSLEHPGIHHVLVDEYQDTNPIQEEIYLSLASNAPHNLCVVGDDDQSLYRFRGGTVECMVNFDQACKNAWGQSVQIAQRSLSTNYRSHSTIISWCDEYIRSFDSMTLPGARIANKPNLSPDQNWQTKKQSQGAVIGNYPSVSFLVGTNEEDTANRFADMIEGLLNNRIIKDPSQCVLLLKSTQAFSADHYQSSLKNKGISIYNPRARSFLDQEEIQAVLGAIVTILDPNHTTILQVHTKSIRNKLDSWIKTYSCIALTNNSLQNYVNQSIQRISQTSANQKVTTTSQISKPASTDFPATLQEMFYHIISFEPFSTWQQDPERTVRLGKLSKVLESYCGLPFPGSPGSTRGILRTGPAVGQIHIRQLHHFYHALVGLLADKGLDEPEDEEIICPPGRFPIMTVHQAKGLQFPFVFVAKLGIRIAPINAELHLEHELRPFRNSTFLPPTFDAQTKADQDYARFFFVAYSRAEYALVLLTFSNELSRQGIGFGGYGRNWFEKQVHRII